MPSNVVFVKESEDKKKGENVFEINQGRVQIREKQKGTLSITFTSPYKDEIIAAMKFFESLTDSEPLILNIADSGDIKVYFRGTAPLIRQVREKKTFYNYGVTLQEIQ